MAGAFAGTMNYMLMKSVSIGLFLFYFVGVYFMATYIRRQYEEPAKLYKIIAVYFALVGYGFSQVFPFILEFQMIESVPMSLVHSIFLLYPISLIALFFVSLGFEIIFEMLVLFIIGYIAYRNS